MLGDMDSELDEPNRVSPTVAADHELLNQPSVICKLYSLVQAILEVRVGAGAWGAQAACNTIRVAANTCLKFRRKVWDLHCPAHCDCLTSWEFGASD